MIRLLLHAQALREEVEQLQAQGPILAEQLASRYLLISAYHSNPFSV